MVLVAILIIPVSQSFASSNPKIFDMTIQLFFVTSDKDCSKIPLETIKFYAEIIRKYFNNYGYPYVSIDHQCATTEQIDVTGKNNPKTFSKYNPNFDLVIFIPDKKESARYMPAKSAYGHYGWSTNPPEIVTATTSLDIFNLQAVWTLSHELSHFILHNLGYPESVYGGDDKSIGFYSYVHKTDKIFDDEHCWLQVVPSVSCKITYYELKSSSGQTFRVMAIYDEPIPILIEKLEPSRASYEIDDTITINGEIRNYDPRISDKVTIKITDPRENIVFTTEVKPDYYDGTFSVSTKPEKSLWSTFGTYKVTALYPRAVQITSFLLNQEFTPEKIQPKSFMNTEATLFINKNIVFGYFDHNEKICFNISLSEKNSHRVIPNEKITLKIMPKGNVYGDWIIPNWSLPLDKDGKAEHCMLWDSRNDRINVQSDYQGNQYTSSSKSDTLWLDSESKTTEPKQPTITPKTPEISQFRLTVEFFSTYDRNRNFLDNPTVNEEFSFGFRAENNGLKAENVKIYVPIRDANGNLVTTMETTDSVVTSGQSIIVHTNYWKPEIVGNYLAIVAPSISSNDPTLIAPPSTINFVVQPKKSLPTIPPKNNEPDLPTSNFGKTIEDICIGKGYTWYNDECYESAQTVIDIQKLDEAKHQLNKLKEKTINEIKDLEVKIFSAEKSLLGIKYDDKNAQGKINEAWDRLKTNKQKLDFLNNRIIQGDDALNKNKIEITENYYARESVSINTINENLIKIPQLVDEAEKLNKPKFCFLFWCW